MQLDYLLVVVVVTSVKVMTRTVAVIFAVYMHPPVVSNYNIQTEPRFLTEPNKTHSEPNPSFFSRIELNINRTEI